MQIYIKKSAFQAEETIKTDVQRLAALKYEITQLESKHRFASKERDELNKRLENLTRTITDPNGRILSDASMHQGQIDSVKREITKWEEGARGHQYKRQEEQLESLREERKTLELKLNDYLGIEVKELGSG